MKRIAAYLAATVLALLCAAAAQAQNQPDDSIARDLPYNRIPLASHLPNSYQKITLDLPENRLEAGGSLPMNWLHAAMELQYRDYSRISGPLPNSFTKIAGNLPDPGHDNIAMNSVSHRLNVVDHLPRLNVKIAGQYPSTKED